MGESAHARPAETEIRGGLRAFWRSLGLAGLSAGIGFGLLAVRELVLPGPPLWLVIVGLGLQGLLVGALLGRLSRGFPALAAILASLAAPGHTLVLSGLELGIENAIPLLLGFEVYFAAICAGAFAVYMARGGGLYYPRFIGLRYLRFKLSTGITVIGVGLGVAGLVVVLSVTSGFEEELRAKVIGANAHAIVQKRGLDFTEHGVATEKVRRVPGVQAVAAFVFGEVMARSGSRIAGVFVKGIEPKSAMAVTPLALVEGDLEGLLDPEQPGILIGDELQRNLEVRLGEPITLLSPAGDRAPRPKTSTFRLCGVFHTGMFEFDAKSAVIGLGPAQAFFDLGSAVSGLALRLTDADQAEAICDEVIAALDGYPFFVRTWFEMNRSLFGALKLNKIVMFIILVIVILVSAFGVVATLIMLVWEKVREIAILKSMGATEDGVTKIFMLEGLTIGGVGTCLGVLLGGLVCALLIFFGMKLDPEVYYIDRLPVRVNPFEILLVGTVALHICFLATLYPSRRAARLRPVDGLRSD